MILLIETLCKISHYHEYLIYVFTVSTMAKMFSSGASLPHWSPVDKIKPRERNQVFACSAFSVTFPGRPCDQTDLFNIFPME